MSTSENPEKAKFVCCPLQGFEAIGSLLRPLVAARVYQAALRQGSKGRVGPVLSTLEAVGITGGWMLMQLTELSWCLPDHLRRNVEAHRWPHLGGRCADQAPGPHGEV